MITTLVRGLGRFPWMTLSFFNAETLWRTAGILQQMEHSSCPHGEDKMFILAFHFRHLSPLLLWVHGNIVHCHGETWLRKPAHLME